MRHAVIDKRADAVIRWLERMKKSYRDGDAGSAFLDAECARADIEALRHDVFAGMKTDGSKCHEVFTRVMMMLRTLSLSLLVVMLSVFPIAKDIVPLPADNEPEPLILAEPIAIVREDISPVATPKRKPAKTQTVKRPLQAEKPPVKPKAKPLPSSNKIVQYDKVFSLIQTGQRALKNNNSSIKIK